MTTGSGAANIKPANGSGFCRNSGHVEGSQTERQDGKLEYKFFRVHIFETPFERENPNASEIRRDGRSIIFLFLKSLNGISRVSGLESISTGNSSPGDALPNSAWVRAFWRGTR